MSEETNQEDREYTQEEIRAMREKTLAFYKSQEKVLAVQCVVEEYKARIKKAQFDAFEYSLKLMQLNQAMRDAEEEAIAEEKEQKSE